MNKIIFFELNEVPRKILDFYRSVRPKSWLAGTHSRLKRVETVSENKGHLSPWNTWPTVHRGVSNERHFITDFNQDLAEVNREFPPIWDILASNAVSTGVFGSLHSYPPPKRRDGYSFYVPDVFAAGSECFPENVELFQDINLRLSRDSARNVDGSIPLGHMARFAANSMSLGFRPRTIADVGRHLIDEKFSSWKVVRRRTYQSVIGFDVFYKLLRRERPSFATFFTNHVASSMHRYWAAAFPADYREMKFEADWIGTYAGEIVFAMDKADRMLGRLAAFVDRDPEYKLLIASSMGQEAVESRPVETQLYVTDIPKFLSALGVTEYKYLPSMLPQYNFSIAPEQAAGLERSLANFAINGQPVLHRRHSSDVFSVDLGHENLPETHLTINGKTMSLAEAGLENVEITDKSSTTAYHIPEGLLLDYHPAYEAQDDSVTQMPTAEITPLILQNFGIAPPEYMSGAR